MVNKITASVVFYFKGEAFTPSIELDLDSLMQRYHGFPPLHDLLATKNNIDSYSYEYEMLLGEMIKFSDAEGDAVSFLNNGEFDLAAYRQCWFQNKIRQHLKKIIEAELDIDEAEQYPNLIHAMFAAFEFGQDYKQSLDKL